MPKPIPRKLLRSLRQQQELREALEPFLRVYRVNEPLALDPELGLRDVLPGVWPTWGNLERLMRAAKACGLDYKGD